jgi:hypothetical protein
MRRKTSFIEAYGHNRELMYKLSKALKNYRIAKKRAKQYEVQAESIKMLFFIERHPNWKKSVARCLLRPFFVGRSYSYTRGIVDVTIEE